MVGSGQVTPQRGFGGFQFGAPVFSSPNAGSELSSRLGILFKGLQKRDSTTKARAAEELLDHLNQGLVEEDEGDALISSWVLVYQGLALDIDRRVRAAAHTITGQLVSTFGRKTARYMKQDISGMWLLGMYDGDRPVAKAAHKALHTAFPTEEKRANFTKAFAASMWSKMRELAFESSQESLSDSRFTNATDAEAKYINTVSAAMAAMTFLAEQTNVESALPHALLSEADAWLATAQTGTVQKSALILLACAYNHVEFLQQPDVAVALEHLPRTIQKADIGNGAMLVNLLLAFKKRKAQSSSIMLISDSPDSLLLADETKKGLSARLLQFIEHMTGPGVSDQYWQVIQTLLVSELEQVDPSREVHTLARQAISNASTRAIRSQYEMAALASLAVNANHVQDSDVTTLSEHLLRLLKQSQMTRVDMWQKSLTCVPQAQQRLLVVRVTESLLGWTATLTASQQKSIKNWFAVAQSCASTVGEENLSNALKEPFEAATANFTVESSRSSLPVLQEALVAFPLLGSESAMTRMENALKQLAVDDPAQGTSMLRALHQDDEIYASKIEAMLADMPSLSDRLSWLSSLLTDDPVTIGDIMAATMTDVDVPEEFLDSFLLAARELAKHHVKFSAKLSQAMAQTLTEMATDETKLRVLQSLLDLDSLGVAEPLELVASSGTFDLLRASVDMSRNPYRRVLFEQLTARLLTLFGKQEVCAALRPLIIDLQTGPKIGDIVAVLDQLSLKWADLELDADLDGALGAVQFPTVADETMICDRLGPARQFVKNTSDGSERDQQGFSAAIRIGLILANRAEDLNESQMLRLAVWCEVVNDLEESGNNSTNDSIYVGRMLKDATVIDIEEFHQEIQPTDFCIEHLVAKTDGLAPIHYYHAALLYKIWSQACQDKSLSSDQAEDAYLKCQALGSNLLAILSCSLALSELLLKTTKASFARNKLASDLTTRPASADAARQMWLLYALLPELEDPTNPVLPRQRVVFLVQALLKVSDDESAVHYARLCLLVRLMKEVVTEYGSFWVTAVQAVKLALDRASETHYVPLQYAACKAYAWLDNKSEGNDDLSEAYQLAKNDLQESLVALFAVSIDNNVLSQSNLRLRLLQIQLIKGLPTASLRNDLLLEKLPSALLADWDFVQVAALNLQKALINEQREDMVLTSSLAKDYEEVAVSVPAALLSIVIDPPMDDEEDFEAINESMPNGLRGYFYAWRLIFGFFQEIPLRMKIKLVRDLEQADVVEPLLGVIFATLGVGQDKLKDLSKIEALDLAKVDERRLKRDHSTDGKAELAANVRHLYSLCLKYTPNLVRSWWLACSDRVITAQVETLTEKQYSPSLIQSELVSVQSDKLKQVLQDDNLQVRIGNMNRDVYVGYTVDEQMMEMVIRLPANYPLRKVTVEGLQKIGVKDAQWRAWLLASQAVLTAHNGTILDAIVQFQKNVSLHFEGIDNCSICFSVLAIEDKSLPTKRCATCKHLFHGSCLYKWFKSSAQATCALCRSSFYNVD